MVFEIKQIRTLTLKNPGHENFRLPTKIHSRIMKAIRSGSLAIGMDFDRTMVNTDEKNRVFPSIQSDKSRVIDPMTALGICGIPIGIFTGNKPSYINSLCVKGYRDRLEEQGRMDAMTTFHVYSQSSTYLEKFNNFGEIAPKVSGEYAKRYLFPQNDIDRIEEAFRIPIQRAIGANFMGEKPIIIRSSGSNETFKTYGPIFENRNGTQISWIAVPGERREGIIKEAVSTLPPDFIKKYKFEPGGQFSIDINHVFAAKNNGTEHFRKEHGISTLLYFGDSVYSRNGYDGNDLPVIKDPNAIIFAVNPHQDEIPKHSRIIKAGAGPDATCAWLTWLLANYVSIRFATEGLIGAEKSRIMKAITANNLQESFVEKYEINNG